MSKTWWSILGVAGTALLTAFTPMIQGAVSSHPVVATILGATWAIIGHFLPQPKA